MATLRNVVAVIIIASSIGAVGEARERLNQKQRAGVATGVVEIGVGLVLGFTSTGSGCGTAPRPSNARSQDTLHTGAPHPMERWQSVLGSRSAAASSSGDE